MSEDELDKCVEKGNNGIYIDIKLTPGSSENGIKRVNPWRECLEIDVSEKAEDGKANHELIKFLSTLIDVSKKDILMTRGQTSSKKRILVKGVSQKTLMKGLEKVF